MLKASSLLVAVVAALGMSSATAQPSPGSSQSGWSYYNSPDGTTRVYAGGNPIGGFRASPSGNTTRFSYQPLPSSPAPLVPTSPGAGNYTTIQRMGDGFTLEQRAGVPVPGRNQSHPVSLGKAIPKSSMAKAIAKTLPIVGNLYAASELIESLFPNAQFDAATQSWNQPGTQENWGYNTTPQGQFFPNAESACFAYQEWWNAGNTNHPNYMVHIGVVYTQPDRATCRTNEMKKSGGLHEGPRNFGAVQRYGMTTGTPQQITEQQIEQELASRSTFPPETDAFLPSLPEQVRKDLANDTAQSPSPVVTRLLSPSGTDVTSWQSPPTTTTSQSVDAAGRPVTNISTTTTTATVNGDTITYNTTNITNNTTITGTDSVTGEPITETTTTTTTTDQTPNTPQPGEDLECGLPGTPPCKIDESGTPGTDEANFDKGNEEIERFKSALLETVQAKLDEISHSWSFTFAFPTGCAPLSFDTKVGPVVAIDMCQYQETIHSLMSMIWAAAGVFGAIGIFLRADG